MIRIDVRQNNDPETGVCTAAFKKTRYVSWSGSVGSRLVTVMCCRSKCVGNPNVVVKFLARQLKVNTFTESHK